MEFACGITWCFFVDVFGVYSWIYMELIPASAWLLFWDLPAFHTWRVFGETLGVNVIAAALAFAGFAVIMEKRSDRGH